MYKQVYLAVYALLQTYSSIANAESGIKPEVALTLAKFGIEFVTGTGSLISGTYKNPTNPINSKQIDSEGTALIRRYQNSVSKGTYAANQLHGIGDVIISTTAVLGGSSGVGAVPTLALTALAKEANGKVRDFLVDGTVQKASASLSAGIKLMEKRQQGEMDELLKAGKFADAANYLDKHGSVLSRMRNAVNNDTEARRLLDAAVDESLRKGSISAIKLAGKAFSKVDKIENQFTDHVKGVTQFTNITAQSLAKLEKEIKDISADVADAERAASSLANAQTSTTLQVQIIQEVLYDKQPAAVKLEMLRQGAKAGLTREQRVNLETVLKAKIKKEEIVSTAASVVGYARDLNTIFNNIGIRDTRLAETVHYGTVAATALEQAFINQNYLGAIATVTGLFGGARPDPVQQQFERVFQEFSKINDKLDNILALQKETLIAIDSLSKQMADLERRINHRFDRIDFELARLNSAVNIVVWQSLNSCSTAWSAQNEPNPNQFNEEEGHFVNFAATSAYTSAHGDKAYKCYDALNGLFNNFRGRNFTGNPLSLSLVVEPALKNTVGIPLEVKEGEYGLSALQRYKHELHWPSFRILELGWARAANSNPGWGNLAGAYALLSTPTASADHLKARISSLRASNASNSLTACKVDNTLVGNRLKVYLCSDKTTYDQTSDGRNDQLAKNRATTFLAEPIVRDQVGTLTKYAMLVAGPRDLAKSDSAPGAYTLDELAQQRSSVSHGRNLIAGALMISDASIAQQAMIYGDLTAWFVFEELWDPNAKRFRQRPKSDAAEDKELFELSKMLLNNKHNPWLQRNVMMLILMATERGCNLSPSNDACKSRSLLYRLAYERFFPTKEINGVLSLDTPSDIQMNVNTGLMQSLFDLHTDSTFTVEDYTSVGGTALPIPRRIQFNLDGYSLAMPDVSDWSMRRLIYPPFMHERVADRARLSKRMANYTALDDMDTNSLTTLVTLLAGGGSQ